MRLGKVMARLCSVLSGRCRWGRLAVKLQDTGGESGLGHSGTAGVPRGQRSAPLRRGDSGESPHMHCHKIGCGPCPFCWKSLSECSNLVTGRS